MTSTQCRDVHTLRIQPRRARMLGAMLSLVMLPDLAHALLANCSVSTTPVSFGTYNVFSPTGIDSTGDIAVTCSPILLIAVLESYEILISQGSSGSFSPRTMSSGSHTLSYNLYTNAARITIWGDGSSGTGTVSDSYTLDVSTPETRHYPVYGSIPAQQDAYVGSYGDTVVVTVNYN